MYYWWRGWSARLVQSATAGRAAAASVATKAAARVRACIRGEQCSQPVRLLGGLHAGAAVTLLLCTPLSSSSNSAAHPHYKLLHLPFPPMSPLPPLHYSFTLWWEPSFSPTRVGTRAPIRATRRAAMALRATGGLPRPPGFQGKSCSSHILSTRQGLIPSINWHLFHFVPSLPSLPLCTICALSVPFLCPFSVPFLTFSSLWLSVFLGVWSVLRGRLPSHT